MSVTVPGPAQKYQARAREDGRRSHLDLPLPINRASILLARYGVVALPDGGLACSECGKGVESAVP